MRLGTELVKCLHVGRDEIYRAVSKGKITADGRALTVDDLNEPSQFFHGCEVRFYDKDLEVAFGGPVSVRNQQLSL